jgi:hypothetical protein
MFSLSSGQDAGPDMRPMAVGMPRQAAGGVVEPHVEDSLAVRREQRLVGGRGGGETRS